MGDWAMDGVSLLPLLRGEQMPERGVGWLFGESWPPQNQGFRYGKWKYVNGSRSCGADCHEQLFDLDVDLNESTDLSERYPDVLATIQANFSRWLATVEKSRREESRCEV